MKSIILVLTLGIIGVIAKPTEQLTSETVPKIKKNCDPKQKTEENTIDINLNGLADDTAVNDIPIDFENGSNYGASIDILMEESIKKPDDVFLDLVEDSDTDSEFPMQSDDIYTDVVNRDPNEIMDTAAGFVPIPIFRNRQKAKRRFATRRQFRRKPAHRRIFFFYPSYGYYPYSSLSYY